MIVFVHPAQQRSSQSSCFAIGRYTYRYTLSSYAYAAANCAAVLCAVKFMVDLRGRMGGGSSAAYPKKDERRVRRESREQKHTLHTNQSQ